MRAILAAARFNNFERSVPACCQIGTTLNILFMGALDVFYNLKVFVYVMTSRNEELTFRGEPFLRRRG